MIATASIHDAGGLLIEIGAHALGEVRIY